MASSGLQRAGSGSVGADTCSGGVGVASAPPTRGLPEVCSPPPSKPLNFVGPVEVPVSPFSKVPVPCSGDAPPCPWLHGGEGDRQQQPAAGSEEEEEEWDQENQQPYGPAAEAAGTPLTWLVSPVSRGGRPPASAPLAIPAPRHRHGAASVLSPGMPTPARDTPLPSAAAVIPLHHCPSFSSWMVSASRPPSPTPQPGGGVADVVGNVLADVTAARRFDGGCPSHLDLLLAQMGDTHYPASGEPRSGAGVGTRRLGSCPLLPLEAHARQLMPCSTDRTTPPACPAPPCSHAMGAGGAARQPHRA